jgi:uncharacterized protein
MTSTSLQDKIAWLSHPESYTDLTSAVEIIETHMSCLFLTDRLVYKMKKPVRYPFLDFTTLEARRENCEEEVRLNRRLARHVYLGAVPLVLADSGLELEGAGEAVEWLVKMRRLPRHLMLDCAIREGRVSENDVRRFSRVLATFYRAAERVPLTTSMYRDRLRQRALTQHAALADPLYGLDRARLEMLRDAQLAFLSASAAAFDARVERELIVDGHGDLRPEHVCLAAHPVFIDCLEFSRDLRIIDPVEELAYLAMECELLGARHVGEIALETYCELTGDAPAMALVRFYELQRAVLRARLALGHLEEGLSASGRAKWIGRAHAYLALAERYRPALGI